MANGDSHRLGKGGACHYCSERRRKCQLSDENGTACLACLKSGRLCLPRKPNSRTQQKRKIEQTYNSYLRSPQSSRACSPPASKLLKMPSMTPSTTAKVQPKFLEDSRRPLSEIAMSSGHCGICNNLTRNSGEKKCDSLMLQCDIEACSTWYHLSCIQWGKDKRSILFSLTTGTHEFGLICEKCLGTDPEIYTDQVTKAIENLKSTIDISKDSLYNALDMTPDTVICEPLAIEKHKLHSRQKLDGFENGTAMQELAWARDENFHGFEENTIITLLQDLKNAVYRYDRQVYWLMDTLRDEHTNSYIENPLKEWQKIDPGHEFTKGSEWFELDDNTNIAPASHLPITAAMRLLLRATPSQSLVIPPELDGVTFSQVHTSLIFWFILDVIQNKRDIYEIPTMKPLRAMMSAVTNFGDSRWEQAGQQVLREIQLRTWQKDMFKDVLVESSELQNDLIKRFEAFLRPLWGVNLPIPLRSPARVDIIRKTIELWSYLQAVGGELTFSHPNIGDYFDEAIHKELDADAEQGIGTNQKKISWVLRRGFSLKETNSRGSSRQMIVKALVII